jgi:hypothetical protein
VQRTQRGVQAVEVLRIDPPEGVVLPFGEDAAQMVSEDILRSALEPARVKWFDKGKGFGFANVFGRPEDVFIHAEVLRVSGFADLAGRRGGGAADHRGQARPDGRPGRLLGSGFARKGLMLRALAWSRFLPAVAWAEAACAPGPAGPALGRRQAKALRSRWPMTSRNGRRA